MGYNFNHLRHWVIFLRVLVIYNLNTSAVRAATNITLDDQNPSIKYAPPGAWTQSAPTELDFRGSHMLTSDPDATALFNFTGIAIYFMSPLWPYTVSTAISLDSRPSTLVNLTDHSRPSTHGGPETVKYHIVWNATGLDNTQHILRISVGAGQPYAVVDGLIYTDATVNVSSSISSASISPTLTLLPVASSNPALPDPPIPSSTTNAPLFSSPKPSKSTFILAIVIGILSGLFMILYGLHYYRKRPLSQYLTIAVEPHCFTPSISTNPPTSAIRPNDMNNNNRTQANDGQNPHYENIGIPPSSSRSHPYYVYGRHQNSIGPGTAIRQPGQTPDRHAPGYPNLFTITERLSPQMGDEMQSENNPPAYQVNDTRI